jgi:hypothetical protein
MMAPNSRLRGLLARVRKFAGGETGSISVEFVLVVPLLTWCFLATFTFFVAYRTQSINVKAAYTIGDQLSRETGFVTPAYIATLGALHDFLVQSNEATRLRITAFSYELDDDTYRVIWSQGAGSTGRNAGDMIADIRHRLPNMPDGEVAILTETWLDFDPVDFVGLDDMTFYESIVTRPRFANQICWNPVENGTVLTSVC